MKIIFKDLLELERLIIAGSTQPALDLIAKMKRKDYP